MRKPFTFNRLRFTLRSPFTIYYGKRKTDHGKRIENGKPKTVNSRGDTVIEVMLAIVLIGGAVALAVTMSNRNLNVGVGAAQRTQALAITQGQIERIRSAYNSGSAILNQYKAAEPYCILSDGSVELVSAQDSKCNSYNSTQYDVAITYNAAKLVFTATTSWLSNTSTSGGRDQLTLSYKLPS